MKLEYFADGLDCGVLLFYQGSPLEVEELASEFRNLNAPGVSRSLSSLSFIELAQPCSVTGVSELDARGLVSDSAGSFVWSLSPSEWERAASLLAPFSSVVPNQDGAFQYLHERGGPEVIYSTARGWKTCRLTRRCS